MTPRGPGPGVTDSVWLWASDISGPSEGPGDRGPGGPGEDRVNILPRRPFHFPSFPDCDAKTDRRKPCHREGWSECHGFGASQAWPRLMAWTLLSIMRKDLKIENCRSRRFLPIPLSCSFGTGSLEVPSLFPRTSFLSRLVFEGPAATKYRLQDSETSDKSQFRFFQDVGVLGP